MEPAVTALLQGRLRSAPFRPLLLLVHGRAQREIPAELRSLAADLPTLEHPLGLVPLLLLPGEHVRHDLYRLRRGIKFPFQAGSCDRTGRQAHGGQQPGEHAGR
jgi:hypothetical protein